MEMAEVIMNPIRQRIFQYVLMHERATVKEIRAALPDVPVASLYRHMHVLREYAVLSVAEERRVRGTVENVYQLNRSALELDDKDGSTVQTLLLGICASFARYFSGENADPRRDMLTLTTCTLMLTDDEFLRFLSEVHQIAMKYMHMQADAGAKARQVTLISAPTDGS